MLLFEWALPLLGPAGAALGWASQYWVLSALAQGLGLCDQATLAHQAGPVVAACMSLLDAEGTQPGLLAPLLGTIQQVRGSLCVADDHGSCMHCKALATAGDATRRLSARTGGTSCDCCTSSRC